MNHQFDLPLGELVTKRRSIRNYTGAALTPEHRRQLEACLDEIQTSTGPFGTKIRIQLLDANQSGQAVKLGTYGMVKGAPHFLVVICENSAAARRDLGFLFEKVVLTCTALGLGTVWLGGTFQKSRFATAASLKANEILPIVSPVGYAGGKPSLLGKLAGAGNKRRKDFTELFFDESFKVPLNRSQAQAYGEALELVRLAPSSVNCQPWRVLRKGDTYHFYAIIKNDIHQIDIGIGLCHFYYAAKELGIPGQFQIKNKQGNENLHYIISYVTS
jgi:nitroreductase